MRCVYCGKEIADLHIGSVRAYYCSVNDAEVAVHLHEGCIGCIAEEYAEHIASTQGRPEPV